MPPLLLNYGLANPRRSFRKMIVSLLLIGAAFLAYRYGPGAKQRFDLLLAQRRCMNFDQPSVPAAACRLSLPCPQEVMAYASKTGFPWPDALFKLCNPPSVLFSHRLRNKRGERLVFMAFERFDSGGAVMKSGISFDAYVISPATLFHSAVVLNMPDESLDPIEPPHIDEKISAMNSSEPISIDFAHADANDPSAFEFHYHIGSFVGTIRGKLKDDDTIELTDLSKEAKWASIAPTYWPIENQ